MARVQKDTVPYFPHDSDASSGDTLTILQSRFGNNGYAFWFKLLEKLASTDGHYIDCRNPVKWQLLLAKLGVEELLGVEIIILLVEMNAIDKELWGSRIIWCQNLVNNLAEVYKNRRRNLPQKPIITGDNTITTTDNAITTPEIPQSKVKYSKVDKRKADNTTPDIFSIFEENYQKLTPHTSSCLNDLIQEHGEVNVKAALEEGIKHNARKLAYVEAILENWHNNGRKSGKALKGTKPRPGIKAGLVCDKCGYATPYSDKTKNWVGTECPMKDCAGYLKLAEKGKVNG